VRVPLLSSFPPSFLASLPSFRPSPQLQQDETPIHLSFSFSFFLSVSFPHSLSQPKTHFLKTQKTDGIECELINPSADIIGDEKLLCAIVCNVHYVARTLSEHPDIRPFIDRKKLSVVGAYYAFNGVVSFFDEDNQGQGGMEGGGVLGGVEGNGSLCLSCSGHMSGSSSPTAGGSRGASPHGSVAEGLNNKSA